MTDNDEQIIRIGNSVLEYLCATGIIKTDMKAYY